MKEIFDQNNNDHRAKIERANNLGYFEKLKKAIRNSIASVFRIQKDQFRFKNMNILYYKRKYYLIAQWDGSIQETLTKKGFDRFYVYQGHLLGKSMTSLYLIDTISGNIIRKLDDSEVKYMIHNLIRIETKL